MKKAISVMATVKASDGLAGFLSTDCTDDTDLSGQGEMARGRKIAGGGTRPATREGFVGRVPSRGGSWVAPGGDTRPCALT